MKNKPLWRPTKFEKKGGTWTGSWNPKELSIASRINADTAIRAYVPAIHAYARGHLMDLGCGKVPMFGIYQGLVTDITCVDWVESSESRHIDVFADLNEPTSLPSDSFDTILSTSVLEHIWNHAMVWSEMARTLRPGGHIILGMPFLYPLHMEPHDYFRWTKYALQKAVEQNGLTVVSLKAYGGGIHVCADLVAKMLAWKSRRAAGWFSRIAGRLLSTSWLRRLSERSAEIMPSGYVLIARKAVLQ